MNPLRRFSTYLLLGTLGYLSHPVPAFPQAAPAAAVSGAQQLRDGQHDFDFHFGSWKTHIKQLVHPLSGSTTWVELNGTVIVRKVWDGGAGGRERYNSFQRVDDVSLQS